MAREKGMGNLQQEKSGRWTMRVGIKGKRYSRSTRTTDREKAERFLQRFLAPLGLGERRLPLADVWLEYVKSPNRNDLSPVTLNGKRIVWMHFAKWMEKHHLEVDDLAGVTSDAIAEYLACLRSDVCASTYNGRVCILREIFRLLAKRAGLEDDPWEGVRLRPDDSHSRRELTMDELRRLLAAAKSEECKVKSEKLNKDEDNTSQNSSLFTHHSSFENEWYLLILIGIYTGLRLGDCCRLDWSSVNLGAGVIQLIPSKTKRHAHGKPVTIPIHPVLGRALLDLTQGSEKCKVKSEKCEVKSEKLDDTSDNSSLFTYHFSLPSGPVLPMISELYRTARWRVSERLAKIFRKANITMSVRLEGRRNLTPEATFHSLRHTFVSFAANAGVPLHIVQSIVGHESTAMTRHYYHENIDALKSAVTAIPSL